MPSIIKIKRSGTAAGAPAALKSGELAYTYTNGVNRLYFGKGDDGSGNATSVVQIGGEFYTDLLSATAGTLTASKALIVDASSKLNNLKIDNIDLDGNTISSTDANGNLVLNPNGTGQVSFYSAYTFPRALGGAGQALVSNGAGGLTFANVNVASTASNLSGGTAGQIPIQSGAGATSFIPTGTAGQFLQAGSNTATFVSTSTMYVGSSVNAEKWTTPRTFTFGGDLSGSMLVDGSQNVTFTATIAANSVALGTDTTGDYVSTGATSGFGLSGSTTGETQTFTVASNATSTNATSTIVFRDGSGNFSAGTITANLTGLATTATNIASGTAGQIHIQSAPGITTFAGPGTAGQLLVSAGAAAPVYTNTGSIYVGNSVNAEKWAVARTVTFIGDTTGTFTIDGSANVSNVSLTIQPDSVALGTDTTGNYVATGATSGFGLSGSTTGENQTFTVASNATSTNATNTIVFRDGSGNFSANAVGLASTTQSTSTSTGALRVEGGVGIGGNLYVGGEIVAQKLTIQFTTVTTTLVETDDVIRTSNATQATSTTTGALQIAGGAGIGGNLWVGGTINAPGGLTGTITTATNISGGTAGQIHIQSGPGITTFAGPGTAGQLLISGGAAAPVYTNTGSIYVGSSVNAEKWTTPRTFTFGGDLSGSMFVDGSQNVTFTATIVANSVALGTDTTGDYVSTGATSGFGLSGSTTGETQTFTVTSNATSTNAASTIVFRNASGNFTAGVITADLVGTASSANNLTGGAAGSLPYQSGAGVTVFLPLGADGKILQVNTATNSAVWGDIDGGTY